MQLKRSLLTSFLACLGPFVLAAPPSFITRPDIHGDTVVFTCEGDLWLGGLEGGLARRITSDAGVETCAHFSPDGKMLAFNAQYDRNNDVYVMPVAGGEPKRLTYGGAPQVLGWTPDGKSVIFRSAKGAPHNRLYTVSVNGGLPVKIAVPQGEQASLAPDGHSLAYVPISNEWMNWFRYRGGSADDIWLADLSTGSFKKLTDDPGVDTTPVWVGKDIYFVSQRAGVSNLFKLDPSSKKTTQATQYDQPVRYPSSDGKRVVFQEGSSIGLFDPATGKARMLDFILNSDQIHSREHQIPVVSALSEVSLGPTGKRLLLSVRGQILSVAAEDGDARVLEAESSARAQFPTWSPDGKKIVFISDRSGEEQLWTEDALGGNVKKLTTGLTGEHFAPVWSPDGKWIVVGDREMRVQIVNAETGEVKLISQAPFSGSYDTSNGDYSFSPDGKWVAYSAFDHNQRQNLYLYSVDSGKSIQLSKMGINSSSPVFDPTGKYLYFVASRDLQPVSSGPNGTIGFDSSTKISLITLAADTASPFDPKNEEEGDAEKEAEAAKGVNGLPVVKVDLDGIADRIVDVPVDPGRYRGLAATATRLFLLQQSTPDVIDGAPSFALVAFDVAAKTTTPIADGVESLDLSKDGSKLLVKRGPVINVVDAATGPLSPATPAVSLTGLTVTIQPAAEWKQIFQESWRIARDFFYDPKMHGVDWNAVRVKYAAMLPLVGDRSDLNRILKDMVSELSVGHAYVGGGETPYAVPAIPMGYLGVDMELDASGKAYKITKLYPGDAYEFDSRSPLLSPGMNVKAGMYLLAIGGQPVRADQDPQALLIGTAGRTITVTVNDKPTMTGARTLRITPIASEQRLRYLDWVESRREYVRKNAGDNFGYVHMSDMSAEGYVGFTKDYFPNSMKDAMIFDVRDNGGGFVSSNVLNQLYDKPIGFFKPRYGESWVREGWAPFGPVAALTNEGAFSDGEYFSEAFKRKKLGPLIGTRTGGGEVGSGGGYNLVDGGQIYVPNYGAYVIEDGKPKWIIEGVGAVPDIEVEQDPALVMAGKDPQLDRAIAYLKAELAKHPITPKNPPPFPNKSGVANKG